MLQMRAASRPIKCAWGALLALLLALRLLGSTGYMPAIEGGKLTIIVCPDADTNAPLALGSGHHHGHARHDHNPCPYAAAGALGAIGPDWGPLIGIIIFGLALLLGRSLPFLDRAPRRERPPAIGPPFPA